MSEIRPRFYVHKDDQRWIAIRFGNKYTCYGSASSTIPTWQEWNPVEDQFVREGSWVEITYANMRPPVRELDDLRAELKEKTREIERLRVELDQENETINLLTRKLKHMLDKRDERPVVRPSAAEERINTQIAKLNDLYHRIDDRISKVVDNTSVQLHAHKQAIDSAVKRIETVEACREESIREAQRIEASRHEALRQRVEKIEQVVPRGSGNLQTIVENLAVRMAADPQNAFQAYVDTRIQRISSWFDTKLSSIAEMFRDQRVDHTALSDRVVVAERKIDALEGSDNVMFEDMQNQINRLDGILHDVQKNNPTPVETARAIDDMTRRQKNLFDRMDAMQARTYHNTVDLENLSVRITNLEAKQ